ncbi:glycosyltransferase, partial [Exiguobacterium sp. B2(2022)]|uniref:glycosyltransferase n=1 Tax=Exiguobacterium sp. B2(2022) TaxID=2992755 RepID=UPI00237B14D8
LNHINSSYKIGFIHCDFLNANVNNQINRSAYEKFDRIACVSESVKSNFIEAMPLLTNKVYTVRNFNDFDEIIKMSNESSIDYDDNYFNVLSVARLSQEKGLLMSISAIKNLVKKGYNIKYHIVGDGIQKEEILNEIKKYQIEDRVILHGEQVNPYRYMKSADLLLMSSFHEAAPMV